MLASHYTPFRLASLLVRQIPSSSPKSIVDLGAGKGALLGEAAQRWPGARLVAVDNNARALRVAKALHPKISIKQDDILHMANHSLPWPLEEEFDIVLSNPPYINFDFNAEALKKQEVLGLSPRELIRCTDGFTVFLSYAMTLAKTGGYVGVIAPDGFVTRDRYRLIRRELAKQHRIITTIELPANAFVGVEASTHIIILRKGRNPVSRIPVKKAGLTGEITESRRVPNADLAIRMDFSFYNRPHIKGTSLKDLGVTILRGNTMNAVLRKKFEQYVHTTNLPQSPMTIDLGFESTQQEVTAQQGDILIGRVGSRVLGRRAYVRSGSLPVSDCVFVVRAPQHLRDLIWLQMSTLEAGGWLQQAALGVGAKVISKSTLAEFAVVAHPGMSLTCV